MIMQSKLDVMIGPACSVGKHFSPVFVMPSFCYGSIVSYSWIHMNGYFTSYGTFMANRAIAGLILGLRPANKRRCYFATTSLIEGLGVSQESIPNRIFAILRIWVQLLGHLPQQNKTKFKCLYIFFNWCICVFWVHRDVSCHALRRV